MVKFFMYACLAKIYSAASIFGMTKYCTPQQNNKCTKTPSIATPTPHT